MTALRNRVGRYVQPLTVVEHDGWRRRPGGVVEACTTWYVTDARGVQLVGCASPEDAARAVAALTDAEVTR
jgi:hypothetical protein